MPREIIEEILVKMRAQDAHLEGALAELQARQADLTEQLMLTRGAVQMLEHLLTLDDEDEESTEAGDD